MGSRRTARIIAFQALYSWEINPKPVKDILSFEWIDTERLETISEDTITFARLIICGTIEHIETVDALIKRQLEHWDFSRVTRVDLAILRISVYALLFQTDVPATVTIDEAINISKQYGTNDSYRFINGVLDSIEKRQRTENGHVRE